MIPRLKLSFQMPITTALHGVGSNGGYNTNTVGYLDDGSGTGSLVALGLERDGLELDDTDYTSESSVNPAGQYLTHDMKYADVAVSAVVPDPDDLVAFARYGHFADYYATSHVPVEETGGWGAVPESCPRSHVDRDEDMPTPEAQEMFER